MKTKIVIVSDKMQKKYVYTLTQPIGKNFDPNFKPDLTPKEMLRLGVFGGKYMTDCEEEFPKDWYKKTKLCPEKHNPELNFFGVNASQPLSVWRKKDGFIQMIREGGSSGIVGIFWGEDTKTTKGK